WGRALFAAQRGDELASAAARLVQRVATHLDEQPAAACGQQVEVLDVQTLPAHCRGQHVIDAFETGWPVLHYARDMVRGLVDARVAEHQQHVPPGRGDQLQRRLERDRARRLRAGQRTREVEAVLGQQRGQVVAGDAARDVRESAADL